MNASAMRRLMTDALGWYAASRSVGLAILLLVEDQVHGRRFAGGPPFRLWTEAIGRWDAIFYRMAAVDGYPSVLPTDSGGTVLPNAWAFFPLFPIATRWLGRLSGLAFEPAAVLLNIVCGAVAAVAIARLVRTFADDAAALRAVGLWAFFPTAFVLQVPYAEACYAACAISFMLALVTRRPWTAGVLLIGAALSRGTVVPLSAAALVFVVRELSGRSSDLKRSALMALAAAAVLAPWLWMIVAAAATGRIDAYGATQAAWGFSFTPAAAVGRWSEAVGGFGRDMSFTITVATLIAVSAMAVLAWVTALPSELRVYAVVATLFLVIITQPSAVAFGSVPRFAFGILTIPIVLALTLRNSAAVLVGVGFTVLQYVWVLNIWTGRMGIAP